MTSSSKKIDVYLEIGKKRTFAGAIEWPGWSRSGRDEASALQALCDYSARYERVLHRTQLGFQAPEDVSAFNVVERLEGNVTTDFGAPGIAPSSDTRSVDEAELQRFKTLLEACWQALDAALQAAAGKELRKEPRGGGRDQEKMVKHVLEAEAAYLARIGWKLKLGADLQASEKFDLTRQAALNAVEDAFQGNLPMQGPRGGIRWTVRYYVRRSAWHLLDHAWEVEDRIMG
jgi:hypothetical protein